VAYEPPPVPRQTMERTPALNGAGANSGVSPRDTAFVRPQPADQPSLRRDPGTPSLRDSILKKPLSSLYKKD
jgi:hypothetical protein